MSITLTDEQQAILEKSSDWFSKHFRRFTRIQVGRGVKVPPTPYLTIGGYAGTGKTTLISSIANKIREKKLLEGHKNFSIAFVSYTGKASFVMKSKLEDSKKRNDFIGTIHSLIYAPKYGFDDNGKRVVTGWKRSKEITHDLIIVDEASMVNKEIWDDLTYYQIPIIAVGDHGQLPPIGGKFNLMENPQLKLTEVLRQSKNNPIIKLSESVRKTGFIRPGMYSKNVVKMDWNNPVCQQFIKNLQVDEDTIILCGFNKTRTSLNKLIRDKLAFTKNHPYPGERVICLKNNHDNKIMNGQLGTLMWLTVPGTKNSTIYEMTIKLDNDKAAYCNLVHNDCFGKETYDNMYQLYDKDERKKYYGLMKETGFKSIDAFDFGYAISVHRSQGSEWDKVVLFEQRTSHWDDEYYKRWLYTAVTRARKKLVIIYNYWG